VSELLKKFLAEWLEWAEGGAEDCKPFDRSIGLCTSYHDWLFRRSGFEEVGARKQLEFLFISDGLDKSYPFGGEEEYWDALEHDRQHLNPQRLAWVRSKVKQYETV
jgi:hypothetical protein